MGHKSNLVSWKRDSYHIKGVKYKVKISGFLPETKFPKGGASYLRTHEIYSLIIALNVFRCIFLYTLLNILIGGKSWILKDNFVFVGCVFILEIER